MTNELYGCQFDEEKKKSFRIRGPIPSSSSLISASHQPPSVTTQPSNSGRTRARISKLLQARELSGNIVSLAKGKCNFEVEYQKKLVSKPLVSKYKATNWIGDGALEQVRLGVITSAGAYETDVLLAGSSNGSLSFFEVGTVGQEFCNGVKCIPDQVWPLNQEKQAASCRAPVLIWRPDGVHLNSSVSCIKLFAKHSASTTDDAFNHHQHVVITTMGLDLSSGSVLVLNLVDPIDFDFSTAITTRSIHEVASLNCSIWTADCKANAGEAVIGTNCGAAVVDLETGKQSWVCRSKTDVLAQQFHPSGNVVLCGLLNGAIVTVDVRERPNEYFTELIRHQIFYSPLHRTNEISQKQWFELKGNICPTRTVFMPSCISSLVSLHHYDQYFLASSMDGTIRLYDYRLLKRGLVQSYEGNVNSHTQIQLGVDPSEKYVMSGGEDCKLRLWSIRSGELLFEEKISNSTPSNICWGNPKRFVETQKEEQSDGDDSDDDVELENISSDAWIRSGEGLFRTHWCF